ncbi:BTB/POZ domain-containing protein 6-like [Ylistrum balloti]|uniref:BTB/POZ domain-containing protein 6-like n=1 Tax=Ylistrum balloti TaxID=509963 RepID=UPI002905E079|nr:BTB/POZ domain-containing protein 6-like [Ylistrum balloti]
MATAQTQEQIWQSDKSLAECLGHLFTSGIACDVTFLVEEGKSKISAHKTILINRSPVFYAMFEGDLAEKGEIVIPDVTREIFTLFLRYLYTDTIEFSDTVAMPVLSVARKYMVDHLVTKCQTFIKKSITPENVCFWLEQSHLHTEESMMEECLRMINKTPEVVLKSKSFLDLCGACVKRITESDNLNVDERMVYEAVIRWGEAECERQGLELTDSNVRKVLGDVFYTIRFPVLVLPARLAVVHMNYKDRFLQHGTIVINAT